MEPKDTEGAPSSLPPYTSEGDPESGLGSRLGFRYYYDTAQNLYANFGVYDEALVLIDEALRLNPTFAEGWVVRGRILDNLGRKEEADASYSRCLKFESENADAYYCKGSLRQRQGKSREALPFLLKAISLIPEHPKFSIDGLYYRSAEALWDLGRYDEAQKMLEEGNARVPGGPALFDALGRLSARGGKPPGLKVLQGGK